jgi:large subunit ribosomal protein L35
MPKLKTHSGTKDRFKVTKTGKVQHGHAFKSHNLSKKSNSRKRNFAVTQTAEGKAAKTIKRNLGV